MFVLKTKINQGGHNNGDHLKGLGVGYEEWAQEDSKLKL